MRRFYRRKLLRDNCVRCGYCVFDGPVWCGRLDMLHSENRSLNSNKTRSHSTQGTLNKLEHRAFHFRVPGQKEIRGTYQMSQPEM